MRDITDIGDGAYLVSGLTRSLTYRPRSITLDDGTTIAHESQGGELSAVWAADLGGGLFVEVAHLGDGPVGGELVMTVTDLEAEGHPRTVALGELWADELPAHVSASWPVAVDLALGLLEGNASIVPESVSKDDVEALHQRLLGALHG